MAYRPVLDLWQGSTSGQGPCVYHMVESEKVEEVGLESHYSLPA
jgi:hypothetical protein